MPEYAVAGLWDGRYRGPCRLTSGPGPFVHARPGRRAETPWTVLPGLVDRHVHLGLVEHQDLAGSAVVEVHDLGWAPAAVLALRADPPEGVTVKVAGPFLTAPGGYPSGRPWAPPGSVRPIASAAEADQAIEEARAAAYDLVKIVLHTGLPLLDDALLTRLVAAAHDAGLPVAVHAEGPGQAARAVDAGADVLAHVPWTERLDDDLLHRARPMVWLSTLAIHHGAGRVRAVDNLRRFRAAGGTVRYGTDLGNGPTPVGPNAAEILALGAAGLDGDDLLTALTGTTAGDGLPADRLLTSPHPLPVTAAEAVAWVTDCRRLSFANREEHHDRS